MKYFKNLEEQKEILKLKSEKIELGIVQDLDKDFKELKDIMQEAEGLSKKISRLKGRGRTLSKKIIDNAPKAQDKFKELGIEKEGQYLGLYKGFAKNALQTIKDNFPF